MDRSDVLDGGDINTLISHLSENWDRLVDLDGQNCTSKVENTQRGRKVDPRSNL